MSPLVTPSTLLVRQIDLLFEQLPGVRDGLAEPIHDARVSTRRMRELVPLVVEQLLPSETEQLGSMLKRVTRRLGRARDQEVKLELLASLEPAIPVGVGELARLRLVWREERDRLVRRAIKTLERLDVDSTLADLRRRFHDNGRRMLFGLRRHASAAPRWERTLAQQLHERSNDAVAAIEHAGGVLFPKRLHGVRVSVKKLRYAMEIATATGRVDFNRDLRLMRKSQEVLGRLHDHDVLAETLHRTGLGQQRLLPLIEMNRHRLHARYLRRREALLDACRRVAGSASRDRRADAVRMGLVAASIPLAVLAGPLVKRARGA